MKEGEISRKGGVKIILDKTIFGLSKNHNGSIEIVGNLLVGNGGEGR